MISSCYSPNSDEKGREEGSSGALPWEAATRVESKKAKEAGDKKKPSLGPGSLAHTLFALLLIMGITGMYLFLVGRGGEAPSRAIGPSEAGTPKPYEGTKLDGGMAPDFLLVDQKGSPVALSDFRGRVVVLAFLDPKCRDVCPLTAYHLRKAYQTLRKEADSVQLLLGGKPDSVIFIGVNVNAKANATADMANATEKWRLAEVPTWHFLTGDPEALEKVWRAYAIAVVPAPEVEGEILHTPGVYLIDQAGRKRWYISAPQGETAWGAPELSELLAKRIRQLLKEAEWGLAYNSTVMNRLADK